jgi:hypothetical protein
MTDSKVIESIIFRTLNNLASGVNASNSLDILAKFWGILSKWYIVCESVLASPNGIDSDFPLVDWEIEIDGDVFIIDGVEYAKEQALETPDYENCMYAVNGMAMRISELKVAIELEDKQQVANILYSLKDVVSSLKNECP